MQGQGLAIFREHRGQDGPGQGAVGSWLTGLEVSGSWRIPGNSIIDDVSMAMMRCEVCGQDEVGFRTRRERVRISQLFRQTSLHSVIQ